MPDTKPIATGPLRLSTIKYLGGDRLAVAGAVGERTFDVAVGGGKCCGLGAFSAALMKHGLHITPNEPGEAWFHRQVHGAIKAGNQWPTPQAPAAMKPAAPRSQSASPAPPKKAAASPGPAPKPAEKPLSAAEKAALSALGRLTERFGNAAGARWFSLVGDADIAFKVAGTEFGRRLFRKNKAKLSEGEVAGLGNMSLPTFAQLSKCRAAPQPCETVNGARFFAARDLAAWVAGGCKAGDGRPVPERLKHVGGEPSDEPQPSGVERYAAALKMPGRQ